MAREVFGNLGPNFLLNCFTSVTDLELKSFRSDGNFKTTSKKECQQVDVSIHPYHLPGCKILQIQAAKQKKQVSTERERERERELACFSNYLPFILLKFVESADLPSLQQNRHALCQPWFDLYMVASDPWEAVCREQSLATTIQLLPVLIHLQPRSTGITQLTLMVE